MNISMHCIFKSKMTFSTLIHCDISVKGTSICHS
uniref:Uncharacterized protein n=1 Tax=Anguilla anguilla TaxID=7936 RepID=A0A0E9PSV1_ANGAN